MAQELLAMFKKSIGDLSDSAEMDEYYINLLSQAQAVLQSEDISESVLNTDLGKFAVVFAAQLLMDGKDIANNPTLNLMRISLSAQTKAERYGLK
jgi:hypothetical protein